MNKSILTVVAAMAGVMAYAQESTEAKTAWYVGIGTGLNWSSLHYSPALDSDFFPENNNRRSPSFSIFAECDFGPQRAFSVRPQFTWLQRGGEIKNIGKDILWTGVPEFPLDNETYVNDINYRLKANCFDFRIPVMYQIGKLSSPVRPYVFVAPELGFVTGGNVQLTECWDDGSFEGVHYDANRANMSGMMFNLACGIGLKYEMKDAFFIGIEAGYSFGLTNTYGKGEKSGDCTGIALYPENEFALNKADGFRRLNSWELQLNVGIPFSAFKKKEAPQPIVIERIVEVPADMPAPTQAVVVEPDCYSLDQIILFMSQGHSVSGKKICAVDDINFTFGKSTIQSNSYPYLDKLASILIRTGANVCVNGHTDNVGTEEANLALSRDRALAVVNYLRQKGVPEEHLSYEYFGFSKPLMDNDTEDGRRMNRRVEFVIK